MKQIDDYHPNFTERVGRNYLEIGSCQPCTFVFHVIDIRRGHRRFLPERFDEFGGWPEYNESKDNAYSFC